MALGWVGRIGHEPDGRAGLVAGIGAKPNGNGTCRACAIDDSIDDDIDNYIDNPIDNNTRGNTDPNGSANETRRPACRAIELPADSAAS